MSRGQKSYITKQAKKFYYVLKKPEDFVSRKVSVSTAKLMREASFPVHGTNVLIHARGKKVHVKRGGLNVRTERQTERILFQGTEEFLKSLEQYGTETLPAGHFVGIKIGNSPTIATFQSLADLHTYAVDVRKFSKEDLDKASIVYIDTTEGTGDDEEE